MMPKRMLRRARKNLRSSVLSDKAESDHLLDVVEGAINIQPEGEEEDLTGTRIVNDSKANATHFFTSESTLMRERKISSTSKRTSPILK